jgi:hypothetical protein
MSQQQTTHALTHRDLENDDTAGKLFRTILGDASKTERTAILSVLSQNPATAISTLSRGSEALGLTTRGSADALEIILGAVDNDRESHRLIRENMSHPRLVEVLKARGDLDSIAAGVVDQDVVLEAMLADVASCSSNSSITHGFILHGWAHKLSSRQDYEELLQQPIMDQPLLHWIVAAIWYESVHRASTAEAEDEEPKPFANGPLNELFPGDEPDDDLDDGEEEDDDEDDTEDTLSSSDPPEQEPEVSERRRIRFATSCNEVSIDPTDAWEVLENLKERGRLEDVDPANLSAAWVDARTHVADVNNAPHLVAQTAADQLDF